MNFILKHVPKAKNLDQIGWSGGYMLVQFKGRPTRYVFGPVAEKDFEKILRVPYPDKLFVQLRDKNQWQCHKVRA